MTQQEIDHWEPTHDLRGPLPGSVELWDSWSPRRHLEDGPDDEGRGAVIAAILGPCVAVVAVLYAAWVSL